MHLKNLPQVSIKVNNNEINRVSHFKYLGVFMDEKLSFDKHVKKTIKLAAHKLSLLRRVRPLLTTTAALQIYKSMILPVIEYGNVLYDTANKGLTSKLQIIQNKSLKVVHKLPRLTPSSTTHQISKIKPLHYRRHSNLLFTAYKRSWEQKFRDYREIRTRTFTSRRLLCPNYKKQQTQKSTAYRTAVVWNKLNTTAKDKPTLNHFKRYIPCLVSLKRLDWTENQVL